MKFTLSWLKDHLDTDADINRIALTLTAVGLEVEEVIDRAKAFAPFVTARVIKAEQHPNADKLRVCIVDAGDGKEHQVVCGAPNARTGMKGVFAPVGAHIPGTGIDLKKTTIRGVASYGMLVSEREMGLSDEHSGVIDLPADTPVGLPFAQVMGLDDPVIEIGLTPNRADCAGVRGIARDLAAAGLGTLRPLEIAAAPSQFPSPIGARIEPEAAEACPLFVGRMVRGVRNGPSPRWLQDRLTAIGLRSISALVDLTNYLTYDLMRPLHVFDAGKVTGDIHVRFARPGESLAALNGKTYALDDGMTAICDDSGVLGLAGIIGGESTGCTEDTTDVYIETAYFDPARTARTGRRLGILSDARYRFERGVDPAFIFTATERVTALILEICGGEASELAVAGSEPNWQRTIAYRPERVCTLGGVTVPHAEQTAILERLGFTITGHGSKTLSVSVPSWRGDVEGEADLVEEILRINGFDRIPAEPMIRTTAMTRPALSSRQRQVNHIRRTLAERGLNEAVTWSFMQSSLADAFGFSEDGLRLSNPITAELDVMRPSVLPNLLQAVKRNADRGFADVALFEAGPAFHTPEPGGQSLIAAGVRAGAMVPRHWTTTPRGADAFDAKADALAALEAAGAPMTNVQVTRDAPAWYHPGRSGVLRLGPTVLANFGEVHPGMLDRLDIKGPIAAFEVMLDKVPQPKRKGGTGKPPLRLSPLQPLQRDFAFIVAADVAAERIVRAARSAEKQLIQDITVFDVYQGKGVEDGQKSIAIAVTLQPVERSLTDADLDALGARIVTAVTKATGAVLRG